MDAPEFMETQPNERSANERTVLDSLIALYHQGQMSSLELGQQILQQSITSQGELTVDVDRRRRTGFPEVVYGQGKAPGTVVAAVGSLLENSPEILVTRVSPEQARLVSDTFPYTRWNHLARTLRVRSDSLAMAPEDVTGNALVGVVTAGTTDESVALEARETLAWMGSASCLIQDIGVSGPYRLLARVPQLRQCAAIVCVAGMEATLPTALAGHVACPVIAVPTSVGYGAHLGGVAALLSMLNSCAANVAVVNIDAGFKAGYLAGLIVSGSVAGSVGERGARE